MRLITIILALVFVAAGVLFGALNADTVPYDLGVAVVELPKGAALLTVLVLGWLLGGLTAWAGLRAGRGRRRNAKGVSTDTA